MKKQPRKKTSAKPIEAGIQDQQKRAITASLVEINKDEQIIVKKRGNIYCAIVDIVNAMRRQGLALQRIAGHDQLTLDFIQPIQNELPWDFNVAKKRVALTCLITEPIKDWNELSVEVQKAVLKQMELMAIAERTGELLNPGSPQDPFTLFLNGIVKMKQDLLKCLRDQPLETRSQESLRTFLDDTKWLADERIRAEELLTKAGG